MPSAPCWKTAAHHEAAKAYPVLKQLLVSAGKMLVHNPPIFSLFCEDVGAASADLMTPPELHGPVKGRDGGAAGHGDMRLFHVVGETAPALHVVFEGFAQGAQTANPFVSCRRKTHKAAVKHLQRTAQIAVIDGPDLCAFEVQDLLTGGLSHGT